MKETLQIRTNLKAGRKENLCPKWDANRGSWCCIAQDAEGNDHPEVYPPHQPEGDWPQNCWNALKDKGLLTKGWACVNQGCW